MGVLFLNGRLAVRRGLPWRGGGMNCSRSRRRSVGCALGRERRVTTNPLGWQGVTTSETAIRSDVEVGLLLGAVVTRMNVVVVGDDP